MARKERLRRVHNRIWFAAAAVLLTVLAFCCAVDFMPESVALEQEVRCGTEEHVHRDECYLDDLLICGRKTHTHQDSCYLVSLKNNDINSLLTALGQQKADKSLEDLLSRILTEALSGTDGTTLAPTDDPTGKVNVTALLHSGASISELNKLLVDSGFSVQLNVDLATTYATTVTPVNGQVGICIYLDGSWQCIGTVNMTRRNNGNYRVQRSAIQEQYYALTGYSPNSDYIFYTTAAPSTSPTSFSRASNNNIDFNNNTPRYFYLAQRSGSYNNYTYTPLNFWSVTETYPDGSADDKVSIVFNGSSYSLSAPPNDYYWEWVDNNTIRTSTSATTITIDEQTIIYARPNRYTATFEGEDGSEISTAISGRPTDGRLPITLPPMPAGYEYHYWIVQGGDDTRLDPGSQYTMTGNTTFVATPICYTVTFESNGDSAVDEQKVQHGKPAVRPAIPSRVGHTFAGWYTNAACTQEYDFSTPVTADITLYAKWTVNPYTVTFVDGGKTWSEVYDYGTVITLPDAENGQWWTDGTSAYEPDRPYTVTGDVTLTATDKVAATYIYKDGTTGQSAAVTPGETITLPALSTTGNVWLGSDGATYQPGATVTLNENMTFTEKSTLTVTYNVNFSDSGLTSSTPPTLAENGLSTATVTVVEGTSASLYTVNPRTYISSHTGGEAAYFLGWVPASDSSALFAPATILTWEVLDQYAVNGTVALTGDWNRDSSGNTTDVRFYIRYDSIAPDTNGNVGSYGTNFYTSQIYHAYAGNAPTTSFTIADKTADNSYAADRAIRALVGDKGDGELWLSGVPDDAWLLEQLITFTKENQTSTEVNSNQYLRIHVGKDTNGNDVYEDVLASELDTDHYSIRWYVFKKEGDGWHADGRLVKKKGQFTVDKIFGGIDDAVKQARDGFYILAENGTVTDGVFTPYDENDSRYNAHILALNPYSTTDAGAARIAEVQAKYPKAVLQLYNTEESIEGDTVDEWLVSDVELDEMWRFTEYAVAPTYQDVSGNDVYYSWYAEYTVTDSDGEHSQIAQFGSVAQVLGKTYALDADSDQGLTVDFTNYYYSNESILIRKIDGDTGQPLGGAEFQLWQPSATSNGEFLQLKFSDSGNGIYTVSPTGTIGSIITNAEGFSVITIDGFSFDSGPLLIKEVTAPSGYAVVNDITIDYTGEVDSTGTKLAGITAITGVDQADFNYHAEYYNENGGVLVVKDHAAAYTSVTVNKVWADAVRENSVTVVLQANGNNAGLLFPSLVGHQQVLSAANNWTYTWNDLPAYANGDPVEWSVKEILIGNNTTMVGSDAFANWIVNYSVPVRTDSDGDGMTDNWAITVTNTVRRTMLNITKTDLAGTTALSGAQFTLTEVEWNGSAWTDKQGASTLTATTGTDGQLIFDNLTAGAFYRLTETVAPAGYLISQADTVFMVNGTGVVYGVTDDQADSTTLNTDYVDYTNPYNLTVKNSAMPELPSTGGMGTTVYAQAGFLLILAALTLLVYKKKKEKGGDASEA